MSLLHAFGHANIRRLVMIATAPHKHGVIHVSNTHATAKPKLPNPMPTHKPDSNQYGLHAAQLNDARRAMAASQPYRPKRRHA